MTDSSIHCYPDREATELRRVLASHLGVPIDCLVAGNGSSELLYFIGLAFLRPADSVLIVGPTYSEYARVAQLMGAAVHYCHASRETGFRFPTDSVAETLRVLRPRMMFVCHPNNPTGQLAPTATVCQWADEFTETLFVIDEAYLEFVPHAISFVGSLRDNIVVLRSMTKAYSLAGLRLGYAVSSTEVTDLMVRVRPPWSVSTIAQNAGIAALQDLGHLQRSLARLTLEKHRLLESLSSPPGKALPSEAPFFLIPVANATECRRRLLNNGILVRDCTSFGLPQFIRVSPQTPEHNAVFLEAWQRLM